MLRVPTDGFAAVQRQYGANMIVGYAAALLNSVPILPFETVSTRVMTDTESQGSLSIACQIWRERGLLGFYEGWEAYPVLSLKPAIQETIIDQVRNHPPKTTTKRKTIDRPTLICF